MGSLVVVAVGVERMEERSLGLWCSLDLVGAGGGEGGKIQKCKVLQNCDVSKNRKMTWLLILDV